MSSLMVPMLGAVSQGILWGVMVLGVYITYKIMNIADLTVDGSFALGAATCAMLVVDKGMNPALAALVAMLIGAVAGLVTGLLHTVFDIPAILAGILTQLGLWSVNLRIMGKSNTPLLKVETVFTYFSGATGMPAAWAALVLGLLVAVAIIAILYWFFGTELGCSMRATGDNEDMIRALGSNTRMTKTIALALSNGLVGLSGALICQQQKYADVSMGLGTIVIGLAAIVIGDVLLSRVRPFYGKLASAVIGSVVFFLIRAIVIQLGMNPNDMKLFSAVLVAMALCIPSALDKWKIKRAYVAEKGEDRSC